MLYLTETIGNGDNFKDPLTEVYVSLDVTHGNIQTLEAKVESLSTFIVSKQTP